MQWRHWCTPLSAVASNTATASWLVSAVNCYRGCNQSRMQLNVWSLEPGDLIAWRLFYANCIGYQYAILGVWNFLTFFSGSRLEVRPPTDFDAKWLKRRAFTQGCAFCSKNRYFSYPLISRPPKRSKFCKFLDLEIFRSILAFNIRGHRENTPYSSSELNESGIVNKQSGGEKLNYILKFYIGVHVTWYRACAMTI